jgi:hypothetical protein
MDGQTPVEAAPAPEVPVVEKSPWEAPETGAVTPASITGNPEDAHMLQAAAEAARNVSGVESTPSIAPGEGIVVPDFGQSTTVETQPVEAPATIELPPPPASVGPAPELPPFLASGQSETTPTPPNPYNQNVAQFPGPNSLAPVAPVEKVEVPAPAEPAPTTPELPQ